MKKFTAEFAGLFPMIISFVLLGNITCYCSMFVSLFDRDNQTYRWDTSLLYNYSMGPKFDFTFDGKTQSTLIKKSLIAGGANQWQEDRSARGTLVYDFSKRLNASIVLSQGYNSLGKRRIQDSGISGSVSHYPNQWLKLSYWLGGMASSRTEPLGKRLDRGVKMAWNASVNHKILGAKRFRTQINIEKRIYRAIPSEEFSFSGEYTRTLGIGDSLMLQYSDFRGKKKYYSSSYSLKGTNTQRKHERALDGRIARKIFAGFNLSVDGKITFNEYKYSAEDDTVSIFGSLEDRNNSRLSQNMVIKLQKSFPVGSHNLNAFIIYRYNGYDENFGLDERDARSAYGELGGGINVALTGYDTLTADAAIGTRSFYHPDQYAPFADRDVVSEVFNLNYLRIWSRYLSSGVRFGYRNFSQYYLSEFRSADNNRNYTYLFSPAISWYISERITINQHFEIQANYITYEFEKRLVSSRNRIFRRGDSRSRVSFVFSDKLTTRLEFGYRYEDYGQLLWDMQWQQLTSWDRRTYRGYAGFDYYIVPQLRLTPGYSFNYKREWEHSEVQEITDDGITPQKLRTLKDRQDQRIITFEVEYTFSENDKFTFSAARRIINGWRRGHVRDDNFTVSLTRSF